MRVLVAGGSGQIGNHLIPLLLQRGFEVGNFGRSPFTGSSSQKSIANFTTRDYSQKSLQETLSIFSPEVFINLASLSSVKTCQDKISLSAQINVDFPINAFETIFNFSSGTCHFIQASSSEMYSGFSDLRINEETMLNPVSIYGTHKAQVHTFLGNIRKANAALTSSLVLFNNESSIRPETFVSKRIIKQLIELNYGTRTSLVVGNPSIRRDWNHPYDTAVAIIKIIDTKSNGDFVIGSGELHSIEDFYTEAASLLGLGKFEVVQDTSLFRAQDNDGLSADASKAHEILGWEPSYNFHSIIQEMVNAELNIC